MQKSFESCKIAGVILPLLLALVLLTLLVHRPWVFILALRERIVCHGLLRWYAVA